MNKYLQILEDAWKLHLESRASDAPTVISTFAGCGGSSLGYSFAGFKELLAVEWDNNAVETFKLNFPEVPIFHGDIKDLSVDKLLDLTELKAGELDVFDGSPPCQGFSTAGKREMSDSRNYLFQEYARLLKGLQPKVFVMENVSGMIKGKMKLIFAEILRELKSCGYKVKAVLMNAMYFNVPQSRQRMIFIGVREDLEVEPSFPKAKSKPFSVKDAFHGLSEIVKDENFAHVWVDAKEGSKTLEALKQTAQGETLKGFSMSRRLDYSNPSMTLQTGGVAPGYPGSSWFSHPTQHRGISTREGARLSGFPDKFRFVDWKDGAKRIGNSVPPLFMKAIAENIRTEILDKIEIKRITQSEAANE